MKTLHLIRGVSGSGKSTLARNLFRLFGQTQPCEWVEADQYFTDKDGNYKFEPSQLDQAHFWCWDRCMQAMQNDVPNIIISNTFTRQRELGTYRAVARDFGYNVQEYICSGPWKDVHNVPQEVLDRQKARFEYTAKP